MPNQDLEMASGVKANSVLQNGAMVQWRSRQSNMYSDQLAKNALQSKLVDNWFQSEALSRLENINNHKETALVCTFLTEPMIAKGVADRGVMTCVGPPVRAIA